jgi:S-DNA-T family DNA segregation ATPase FtsK/SpoIIIE
MFAAIVVGSIPRMGKTFLMRLLLLIAALDPRAEVHAFDFKGTGDFGALEPVCHRYRAGEEDDDIEYVVEALRELKEELRRRAKVIKSLPRTRCPESKVTPALAGDRSARCRSSTRSTARRSRRSAPTWSSAVPRSAS